MEAVARGELASLRVGRRRLVSASAIAAFIDTRTKPGK